MKAEEWDFEKVLQDAITAAGAAPVSKEQCPDAKWWEKLCAACAVKTCSPTGSRLLRDKVVHSLGQRLAIDEVYKTNESVVEHQRVSDTMMVVGIPRSTGHMAATLIARTGVAKSWATHDVWTPSVMNEFSRKARYKKEFSGFHSDFPNFCVVGPVAPAKVACDLMIHLHIPYSFAWGLLHGLDEFLYECLQEPQDAVYTHVAKVMRVFEWYRLNGDFYGGEERLVKATDNPILASKYGIRDEFERTPFVIHSPFAILHMDALHRAFPDMRVIWTHRALNACIGSLCSALAHHDFLYTNRRPTDTQLAAIGEKIVGMFGSGTELAVDYMANFSRSKSVHWLDRDVRRHGVRLMKKTFDKFDLNLDRYRYIQAADAQTEMNDEQRPLHDAPSRYFAVSDSLIREHFDAYVYQFPDFVYEKRYGIMLDSPEQLTHTSAIPMREGQSGRIVPMGKEPPGHMLEGTSSDR